VRVVECFFEGIAQWPAGEFFGSIAIQYVVLAVMMCHRSVCIFVHGLE
jgi:hypothetical protein